ncbi:MAG: alpha/beta hydrolase family protein, partial [Verrucomicrobiota bacterium]
LLIGALSWRSKLALPRNIDALMEEIYFHGEILVAPAENKAGTSLAYVRTVEQGVGVFLLDLKTLADRQIMLAKPDRSKRNGSVRLFGWSPEDRHLAFFTRQNKSIVVCDGLTGDVTGSYSVPASVEAGGWLTGNSLALMDDARNLFLLNLEPDSRLGQFGAKGLVKMRKLDTDGSLLVADSSHSVAFAAGGNLWSFDVPANRLKQLTQFTNATIASLDYSRDNFKYLLGAAFGNPRNLALYEYDLRAPLSPLTPLPHRNLAFKGQWIQGGTGTAYVGEQGNRFFLAVRTKDAGLQTNLFTAPRIDRNTGKLNARLFTEGRDVVRTCAVSPKGDKIYTVASVDYEPLTIWEYDIASQTLRNVIPKEQHLKLARRIEPVPASVVNKNGDRIDYYYLPPAGMKPGRKYPVVMDQFSDLGYQPNSQFLANAGILYVTVNPVGVGRPEMPTRPEDTFTVYNELLKHPNVDPKRIYLFGSSAGTASSVRILAEHPELWRGAIMLSPVAFPRLEPGTKMCRSFFFSVPQDDIFNDGSQMEKFIHDACGHSIRTQVEYVPGGHIVFSVKDLKKTYKAAATFILADY